MVTGTSGMDAWLCGTLRVDASLTSTVEDILMTIAHLQRLYTYNQWANQRVWDCVLKLNEEQFRQHSSYSVGSVHEQLVHTLEVERLWLDRVQGKTPDPWRGIDIISNRPQIRSEWDLIEVKWQQYLAALSEAALNEEITFISITGNARRVMQRWEGIMQAINHATDHRAQTLALIHQMGGESVAQDLAFFVWGL
jgi:uncharacterized damage-inducible protein DinB